MGTTLLAGCASYSTGNPKLQVFLPSCNDAQYQPLPVPARALDPKIDARLAVFLLAGWAKENHRRAAAKDACEARVREDYAVGGVAQ